MYLFFDTETTGLPQNWHAPITDSANWPRMVQLAWLLYDVRGKLLASANDIVRPEGFLIPEAAAAIHGISQARALREGKPLAQVLEHFNGLVRQSVTLVAHNVSFDIRIVGAEFIRTGLDSPLLHRKSICTMEGSKAFCAIRNTYGFKRPSLSELYEKIFQTPLLSAHDAGADVAATARCFWYLQQAGVL
jgi:DNA polymerase III epsilon subunit-like protein